MEGEQVKLYGRRETNGWVHSRRTFAFSSSNQFTAALKPDGMGVPLVLELRL